MKLKNLKQIIKEELEQLNEIGEEEASKELEKLCGSENGRSIFRRLCCKLGWRCCKKKMNKCWD